MTRAAIEEWVHSLRPGDEVAVGGYVHDRTMIGIVEKVTPSGIVRTKDHGSYKLKNITNLNGEYEIVHGFGNYKHIEPWTPGLYEIAKSNMEKIQREKEVEAVRRKVKDIAYAIAYERKPMTYEQALKLIAIFEGGESDGKEV